MIYLQLIFLVFISLAIAEGNADAKGQSLSYEENADDAYYGHPVLGKLSLPLAAYPYRKRDASRQGCLCDICRCKREAAGGCDCENCYCDKK